MWTWLQRLVAPPVFSRDEEKTRTAYILNAALWFNILAWALSAFAMPFVPQPLPGLMIILGALVFTGSALAALRAGYVKAVAWGFVLFLWLIVVVFAALSGGIVNPETAGFLVVLLAAGMLSGLGALLALALFSLAAAILITILQVQGLLPILLSVSPFVGLLIMVVNIVLCSGLLWVTISGWQQAIKRSHQYARDLEQERANLETRVMERTQLLETAHREAEAARQQAEEARTALEAQVWQTAGLVRLSEALRGDQDITAFCQNAVQAMCLHLQIPIGALYLAETNQLVFRGGYAFIPTDEAARFALGEGLLGQAALEGKPIILEDVPSTYLMILSGLGEGRPSQVVVWPILYNQHLMGVLEFGLLSAITAEHRQFLERACEYIAIALQTAQTRQRVNELLTETQAQAEELQTQEEELRAINEELTAQAEQLETHR